MPSVGSYWYDREGRPTVVRVLADDGDRCAYLNLNEIQAPNRIHRWSTEHFVEAYQQTPAIADEWIGVGTHWYWRDDLTNMLEITSVERDPNRRGRRGRQIMTVTTRDRGAVAVSDLTSQYVRVEGDVPSSSTRYWVMGRGIRAAFLCEVDARAFLFETTAALGIQRGSVRVYSRPLEYRPGNDHLLSLERSLRVGVGREEEEQEDEAMTGRGPALWSQMSDGEHLMRTLAHPPPRATTREATEQVVQAILGAIPEVTLLNVTVTCDPTPSLWDHLTADDEAP